MNTPETMTKHDFSDLTPPDALVQKLIELLRERVGFINDGCLGEMIATAYRAGAEQAAERLKGQWPTPITDRPPSVADGDDLGRIQFVYEGGWSQCRVEDRLQGEPWHHTPRWQPPAPPVLTPQQQHAMDALDNLLKHCTDNTGEATLRNFILGGEA